MQLQFLCKVVVDEGNRGAEEAGGAGGVKVSSASLNLPLPSLLHSEDKPASSADSVAICRRRLRR